jgi:hypothetical protein
MRRVGNTVEGRRERQKIWSPNTLGFGGLQPLEIAQNRQNFVWKSLEQNTLDLEKLGEIQGGPPLFRLRCVSLGERCDCGTRGYTTVVANATTVYLVEGWIASASPRNGEWRNRYTPDLLMSASSSARVTGTRYSATHSSRSRAR